MTKYQKIEEYLEESLEEAQDELTEEILISNVRYFWKKTREGRHDDCMCHEFYLEDLKHAILDLRSFRRAKQWQLD